LFQTAGRPFLLGGSNLHRDDLRNSLTSLVVAEAFSSIIQWPEAGTIAGCTSVAAKRITVAIIGPNGASHIGRK
jgi:hypothetical protein